MSGRSAKRLRRSVVAAERLVGLAAAGAGDTFGRWFVEVCKRPWRERVKFACRVIWGK